MFHLTRYQLCQVSLKEQFWVPCYFINDASENIISTVRSSSLQMILYYTKKFHDQQLQEDLDLLQ